ncbi:MAG: peptidase S24 [Crocinitomicaceae bacterium]|nr:peptidase S24 [Crocinitomicaceae bacterium]
MSRNIAHTKRRMIEFLDNQGISKAQFFRDTKSSPSNFKGKGLYSELGADMIAKILAAYPDIDVQWLLTGKKSNTHQNTANEPTAEYGKNEAVAPISHRVMEVPLVNQYAHAGYMKGFADQYFIEELPKVPFIVDKEYKGEYICFEVKGDSMDNGQDDGYIEGDVILCRNVKQEYWKSKLHINKWDFVIVHKTDGILVKRITKHNVDTGDITLHSLNDYYDDITVNLMDIDRIFNIIELQRKRMRR